MVWVLAHEEIVQVNSGRAVTPPILKGKPEGRYVRRTCPARKLKLGRTGGAVRLAMAS
jgi:hypothetical protein